MAVPEKPITRKETYLAGIAGQNTVLPEKPLTREESYLAAIAGQDVVVPNKPITREEAYLDAILQGGGGGGGGGGTDVPVLNLENIYSQNDVNDISATFTARQTSAYMVILTIESESTLPNISQCFVNVNGESQSVFDYYVNSGYGFVSRCAVLNLHEGDEISARLKSTVDMYGVSASIMLVRLSSAIGNFSLKADDFTNTYDGDPEAVLNVERAGFYLLFFFSRHDGVGIFKELSKNDMPITQNIIICSQGSSWQVSHGMCILYADPLDALKVKTGFNGYVDACGIMSLKKI
jgi:hypothetical protein